MSLLAKVGRFTAATSTGNQDITTVGFQPNFVMFFASPQAAAGASINASMMIGAARSSTSRFYNALGQTDATDHADSRFDNSKCIGIFTGGTTPSVVAAADFVSFLSNGFRINWTAVDTTARPIDYIALGNLQGASIVPFSSPTSIGNQAVTGAGFQPNVVMILGTYPKAPGPPITQIHGFWTMGMGDGTTQRCVHTSVNDGGDNAWRQFLTTGIIAGMKEKDGTVIQQASLSSLDSDGFTLNWSTTEAARYYSAICLRWHNMKVGSDTQKTSTGTKATTTGNRTKLALLMQSGQDTINSIANPARFNIGAFDESAQFARWWGRSFTSPADADMVNKADKVLSHYQEGTPSLLAEAEFESKDSSGFTLDWTTADATARQFAYLAFAGDAIPLAGVIASQSSVTGSLGAVVPIQGAIASQSAVTGALSASLPISAAIAAASSITGVMGVQVPLAGSVGTQSSVTGSLSGTVPVHGAIAAQSTVSGSIDLQLSLTGLVAGASLLTGTAALEVGLASTISAASGITGTLQADVRLSQVHIDAQSAISGTATSTYALRGSVAASAGVQGALSAQVPISASIGAQSGMAGYLSALGYFGGLISCHSSVAGALSIQKALNGSVDAHTSLTGLLGALAPIQGSLNAQSGVAGFLSSQVPLAASVDAQGAITAALSAQVPMSGQLNAQSGLTGLLSGLKPLAANLTGQSDADAALRMVYGTRGSIDGTMGLTGRLIAQFATKGSINAVASLDGRLCSCRGLFGTLVCQSGIDGLLHTDYLLRGNFAGVSGIDGGIFVGLLLEGSIEAVSTITGLLVDPISGAIVGTSNITGRLHQLAKPPGWGCLIRIPPGEGAGGLVFKREL